MRYSHFRVVIPCLRELGLVAPETPSPLNLFMNIPWTQEGRLTFEAPPSMPVGYALLEAELDLVIVFSACPHDIIPINGLACKPTDSHLENSGLTARRRRDAISSPVV